MLHQYRPVRPREKARCVRCGSVLYRGIHSDPNRMAAITLGAIVTFLIAQFFPIVELQIGDYSTSATLLGSIRVLWHEQMQLVAAVVFLFTMVLPAVELGALFYVTMALRAGRRPPGFDHLLRAVGAARRWGMTEVLMIGILITIVKMTSLAQVLLQPGLFAFGVLTLMLAIVVSFDPKYLWNIGEHLLAPAARGRRNASSNTRRCPPARISRLAIAADWWRRCRAGRAISAASVAALRCTGAVPIASAAPGRFCWRPPSCISRPCCCR